jgi:F0F1-type ATP synthase delta subunit
MNDPESCLRNISGRLDKIQEDLTELKSAWEQHVSEYGDLLKHHKLNVEERAKLRSAVIEKSVSGAVWAVLIFIGITAWAWLKDHLR